MKLVVGLGNPGSKYERTRHNIGFDVIVELARRHNTGAVKTAHQSEIAEFFFEGEKILLVAPQTFMNLSGRAVGSLQRFYNLEPEDILVVCDDLNLPCGQLRLRAKGSSGGQNGLKDIIAHLGTEEFPRLRIGIGRPPGQQDVVGYVLKPFSKEQKETIDVSVQQAADGVENWVEQGIVTAMQNVNSKK